MAFRQERAKKEAEKHIESDSDDADYEASEHDSDDSDAGHDRDKPAKCRTEVTPSSSDHPTGIKTRKQAAQTNSTKNVKSIVSQISDNIDELFAEFIGGDEVCASTTAASATSSSSNNKGLQGAKDGDKVVAATAVTSTHTTSNSGGGVKRPAASMNSVSDKLSAPKRASILERSRDHWHEYKQAAGDDLDIELDSANRGRAGFVDKMEFLARTDFRQFERECDVRAATRRAQPPPPPPL